MHYVTPDLCDAYPELVQVVEPMFSNFGGRDSFGGEIVTIKCFEDNSLVKEQVDKDGKGKVLVVDGGGSLRRALLGDMLAEKAAKNGWEGIVVYGCIRDVDVIAQTDLGVQAPGQSSAEDRQARHRRSERRRDLRRRHLPPRRVRVCRQQRHHRFSAGLEDARIGLF